MMDGLRWCFNCRCLRPAAGFKQLNRYRVGCAECCARRNKTPDTRRRPAAATARHIAALLEKGLIE